MVGRAINSIRYPVLIVVIAFCLVGIVQAATGNIDPTDKWAWSKNVGWINFAPDDHGGVTVYADHLEGYAWAENVGWMRLGSYEGGGARTYANDGADTYGVNNDGAGNLSGYAWSKNVGWINFDPDGDEQVTIDPATGSFDGYAWAENTGWIHFQGTGAQAYSVVTAWRQTRATVGGRTQRLRLASVGAWALLVAALATAGVGTLALRRRLP